MIKIQRKLFAQDRAPKIDISDLMYLPISILPVIMQGEACVRGILFILYSGLHDKDPKKTFV